LNDTGNESVSSQAQQPTLSDAVSKKYYSFIHWALVSKKNDFTFDREENMSQALAVALREDDVIAIPMLLHAGVDLSSPISGSSLPLCYATTARCVDLLVDAGADVDELYTDDSLPAVAYAAMSGNVEVINALLARGADVNLTNVKGWCALMMAIQFKEAGAVKALLQADPPADVNCQTIYGTTAVAFASMKNSSDILKLLIDAGADIHIADCDGYSPIMLATTTDCLKLFLKSDSNIIKNIRRSNGYTGLCALLYFWLDPEEDVDVRDEPLTDGDVASCMKLVLDHALQYYCVVPVPTVVASGAQKRKKRASD
jgi:ankyrin repeat protein